MIPAEHPSGNGSLREEKRLMLIHYKKKKLIRKQKAMKRYGEG